MIATGDEREGPSTRLSPRQQECLQGVLDLKSAKEIGRELGISPHAVEKHLRVAREKFGVASSADAARLFASQNKGSGFPHGEVSDLAAAPRAAHQEGVLGPAETPSSARLEDTPGALSLDQPLTPRQTLLTIFAVSLGSIIGLLLLIACAQAVGNLVSN